MNFARKYHLRNRAHSLEQQSQNNRRFSSARSQAAKRLTHSTRTLGENAELSLTIGNGDLSEELFDELDEPVLHEMTATPPLHAKQPPVYKRVRTVPVWIILPMQRVPRNYRMPSVVSAFQQYEQSPLTDDRFEHLPPLEPGASHLSLVYSICACLSPSF